MFGIEWLVGGLPIDRDCVTGNKEQALAEAHRRARDFEAGRHRTATAFRLLDGAGETVGVYRLPRQS